MKEAKLSHAMQRSVTKLLIVFAAVAGFVIAVCVSFVHVTEQNVAAKRAQVRKPAAIDAYQQLLAELSGDGSFLAEERTDGAGTQEASGFRAFPEEAIDIIAGYERLFEHLEVKLESLKGNILRKKPHEWTDDEKSKLRGFLAANQELVREIRAMADRGDPVYPLDFSKSLQLELLHDWHLRQCTELLRADAVIKAENGRELEAFEDVIAGMKLGDALAWEPITSSQNSRMYIYSTIIGALQASFDGKDLSQEQTRRLISHIAQADNRHAFAESLAGKLYMVVQFFSDLRSRDPVTLDILNQVISPSERTKRLHLKFYMSPLGRPWLNMDEAACVDLMTRVYSVAELPYYEAAPELSRIQAEVVNLPSTRLASTNLSPSYWLESQADHEAMLDLVQLGILVEQHHARTGSYPESLDAVAPELGGSLPVDPFTGEPYQYKPSDDGFLLYSIGQNLIDDGGRHEFGSGDIVWRGKTG